MRTYAVKLECSGPLAMYARPDTGGHPTSYPAPTWSATKGILKLIAFLSQGEAWFYPTCVQICRRVGSPGGWVSFQPYAFNYGGPLRKRLSVKNGTRMQVFAMVVASPCYRIYAEVVVPAAMAGATLVITFSICSSVASARGVVTGRRHSAGPSLPATIGVLFARNGRRTMR